MNNINLTVGQQAIINISLQVGNTSETVKVEANSNLLNASNAEISQVINERS